MASPMTTGGQPGYGWSPASINQPPMGNAYQNEADDTGVQVRPMALKVHYTFDKDSKINCLARWPHNLQVQTVPLDEHGWIGIVDIRLCIQAIAQGSPELVAQHELDYAIYAMDFSEPDTPLVGQGMLSRLMNPSLQPGMMDDTPKMVTGRVTKNVLGLFGNGARETLEVRLKLSESPRVDRAANMGSSMNQGDMLNTGMMPNNDAMMNDGLALAYKNNNNNNNRAGSNAHTPTDTTEWNTFMQSNPGLGRSASISTMYQSPNMMPAHPDMMGFPPSTQPMGMTGPGTGPGLSFDAGTQPMAHPASRPASQAASRPNSRQSFAGASARPSSLRSHPPLLPTPPMQPSSSMGNGDSCLNGVPAPAVDAPRPPPRPRRSRATGRPRGRPKKRPANDGNTSAAEEPPTDNDAMEVHEANEAANEANNEANEANETNDATDGNDGEDAHKKKRVKTTKVDYPTRTSLDLAPDSLRVAASTNGSLRTLRPVMMEPNAAGDGLVAGAHLQDHPRAPTPVPQGSNGRLGQQHARKMIAQKALREPLADSDSNTMRDASYSPSVGVQSPADSLAPSPETYTPEESPADIGSSPPVPRTTSYVPHSSPMPSSPPLPPMRLAPPDSGFMSGGVEGPFGDDDCMPEKEQPPQTPFDDVAAPMPNMDFALPLPPSEAATTAPSPPLANPQPETQPAQPLPEQSQPEQPQATEAKHVPVPAPAAAPAQTTSRTTKSNKRAGKTEQFEFKSMEPGPPELLPTTMLYNPPPPPAKPRNKGQRGSSAAAKSNTAALERSNSEPNRPNQQQQSQPRRLPFLLPAGADPQRPTMAQLMEAAKPRNYTSPVDVPDDMQELAMLLAASAEHENDAVSLINTGDAAEDASKSPQPVLPQQPAAEVARMTRGLSANARATAVPASDPPGLPPLTFPTLPPPPTAYSEAPGPASDMDSSSSRISKNRVRKEAIRERLQKAIESGQMPSFCQNCGAIETPTWRKMWTQDHDGEPEEYEYSEKPGHVTAVDILERDDDGKVKKYRLVKKSLSSTDDSKLWTQMLLCNPCGIWLVKAKSHRPADRWDRDASRLGQPKGRKSRSRKSRSKSETQTAQPTSEAYFTTDPAGPADQDDTLAPGAVITRMSAPATATPDDSAQPATQEQQADPILKLLAVETRPDQEGFQAGSNQGPASTDGSGGQSQQGQRSGSTHSRGSGTAGSPIAVDETFGATRRLLFPSPRKDGVLKVLGDLAVNVIGSVLGSPKPNKEDSGRFEPMKRCTPKQGAAEDGNKKACDENDEQDDMVDLFGTPPPKTAEKTGRPSTPPPRSGGHGSPNFANGPFKTPTRPTPSHRPITRSVSKTIRSGVSGASFSKSPMPDSGAMVQRTPSKTPRSVHMGSVTRQQRRMTAAAAATPGRSQQQGSNGLQTDNAPLTLDGIQFDTPFTSLNKLLSEANDFTTGSPSHGLTELDLASLANLDSDGLAAEFTSSAGIDFGSYLDTNMAMTSSSPLAVQKGLDKHLHQNNGENGDQISFGGALSFEVSESMWTEFNDAMMKEDGKQ